MAKYRIKQIEVDAFQYGSPGRHPAWFDELVTKQLIYSEPQYFNYYTANGTILGLKGDFIVKDFFGNITIWKETAFKEKYELIKDSQ
jgi:hypothetical protein